MAQKVTMYDILRMKLIDDCPIEIAKMNVLQAEAQNWCRRMNILMDKNDANFLFLYRDIVTKKVFVP